MVMVSSASETSASAVAVSSVFVSAGAVVSAAGASELPQAAREVTIAAVIKTATNFFFILFLRSNKLC